MVRNGYTLLQDTHRCEDEHIAYRGSRYSIHEDNQIQVGYTEIHFKRGNTVYGEHETLNHHRKDNKQADNQSTEEEDTMAQDVRRIASIVAIGVMEEQALESQGQGQQNSQQIGYEIKTHKHRRSNRMDVVVQ